MVKKNARILVTGGGGFIGSEFVRQCAKEHIHLTVIDALTYAGDLKRIEEATDFITFVKLDLSQKNDLTKLFQKAKPDTVVHFAAETHVDRSINDSSAFITSNIIGTQNLIDVARLTTVKRFIHISTDEVYGSSMKGRFREIHPLKPNNPYAASKAAAEHFIRAAIKTFNFPAIIIRPSNNYGPWQYPEKFMPVVIWKALNNQKIPVYGKGKQIREWLFVSDCVDAILTILNKGTIGEVYNIGSYFEQENIKTAEMILHYLGKPPSLIQFVKDRPGHDFRYSVNCAKLRKLGWRPKVTIPVGIERSVDWYTQNQQWIKQKLNVLDQYWKSVYQTK
ncbi:MAG: dTDP-glucose 4,6-dehydratase [Candidatus Omnitrophica bacterium]|nr:dTDP-glucose 4,6-dehydratase [Candidatus Omnitrophota bacterium]